jgi:O-antigen/teichoic acid export membrane protein
MEALGKKIVKGVTYNAGSRILMVGIQGITSIILARILSSSDYGVVAFAAVFISFLSQFSDFGVSSAIIQRKNIDAKILNTAFTIRNAVSIVLVFLATVMSFVVPIYFDIAHVDWIIRLLALNFILNSLAFISSSLLRRKMEFFAYNLAQLFSTLAGSLSAIALAFLGYGFWSLVFSNILSSLAYAVIINRFHRVKLRIEFDMEVAKEIWRFGFYVFLSGLFVYALFNADNFIVGAIKGTQALGYYSLAFDWGTKISTLLSLTVLSVLFPAYSRIKDDKEKLKKAYLDSVKYVSFLSIMVNGTLFCISEDFLKIVLGGGTDKWLPALSSFRILCIYGIVRAILEPLGNVIMALGDSKVLLKANAIASAVQLLLLYPALNFWGIEGVAVLVFISYALQYFIYIPYIKNRVDISFASFGLSLFIPVFSSTTFFIVFILYRHLNTSESIVGIVFKSLIYLLLYVILFCTATKFQFLKDLKSL